MRLGILVVVLCGGCHSVVQAPVDPVLRLHGHNDYLQPVPLVRALEHGLGSLEADIYLVEGELRVGHERWQLRPGRTLESMYLDPLLERFERGERLRADGRSLVLLVDIKAEGARVYGHLRNVLRRYEPMLTQFVDGRTKPGAVTVLLSGSRPRRQVASERRRLCALDGRLEDLDAEPSPAASLIPWVSSSWRAVSDWTGSDDLMAGEIRRVQDLVAKAHAQGRELRFWAAPDRKEAWGALHDFGVDRICTDQPKNAARWLRRHRAPSR